MTMIDRRVPQMILAILLAALPLRAQGAPDYSGFSSSLFIPFTNQQSVPLTEPPALSFSVAGGEVWTKTMDTGSVGIAMAYDRIPSYPTLKGAPGATPGYEFLSSSKMLWVGTWVPTTVTFYDGSQPVATASVPVLAVEQAGRCPSVTKESGSTCPCTAGSNVCPCLDRPDSPTCACPASGICPLPSARGRDITYMGVGFGQEADFQPQGTPDKNPLLNLTTIGGQPVMAGSFNPGYIIGTTGITVGLTSVNTGGFSFIKLAPYARYPGDWLPASMCVQINGSDCEVAKGTVLVDTGIAQSYITVPPSVPLCTEQKPDPSDSLKNVGALASGTTVIVNLPGLPNPVEVYKFTIGQGTPAEPLMVIPWATDKMPPFVNTGRNFLRKFQFLYDARNGYVGLKPQAGGGG